MSTIMVEKRPKKTKDLKNYLFQLTGYVNC